MTIMHWYTAGWMVLCLAALLLAIVNRQRLSLFKRDYLQMILEPWKVITALTATAGLVIMAPYTGDPTWDYVDAFFMSVMTYLTAPWTVGVLYRAMRRQEPWQAVYVACCCWFFSASWSYDLYIWLRDGYYPLTWVPNIFASSFLYLMAGILWNLEWQPDKGVQFAFMADNWPHVGAERSWRIFWLALPIILLVAVLMGQFLLNP